MPIQINIAGIKDFEQAIDRLAASLDKTEQAMRQMLTSGSAIDKLYGGMANFKDFMATLNNLNKTGLSGLRAVTTGMRDLAKAMKDLPASGPSTRFFADIKDLLKIIQVASVGPGTGQTFNILKDFVKNMREVSNLAKTSKSDSKNMARFIRDFGEMMIGMTKMMQVGSRLSDFDTITASVARFGAGLKKIMIELGNTSLGPGMLKKLAQITVFTQTLGLMMRSLPGAVGSGAKEGSALDEFSKMMDRLGRGFRNVASIKDVGIKKAIDITKFLGTMALGLRVISRLPGNIKQAESFSHVISAVFGAIERVSKLTVNEGRFGKMVFVIEKPLRQLINTVIPLIQKLTNIKSKGADLDGMARVIQTLGIFFERMEKVKIRPNDFKGFKSAVRELADGLNQLEKVNVDTRKLNSIGAALEGMAKSGLSIKSIRGAFERSGFNLGNEIKRGIILAGFNQFFHRLFMGSLRDSRITAEARGMGDNISNAIKRGIDFTSSVIRGLREIGDTLRDVGERFMQFGRDIMDRFGIGSLMQSQYFQAAAGFEELESQLRVFGGLTEEQLEQAKAFANQIGIDYPLSANEALAATLDLIKAGQDLSSTEFILPAAADLAALSESGSIEASTTALIAATGAFEEFRDGVEGSFENVSVATDIIAAGGDVSIASIDGINEALANVGPAAASAGQNLEETVAILAQLADAGIQGADAGTGLRSALNSIVRPQSIAELNRLGIAAYDAEGNFEGLGNIAGQLSERYDELGYTEAQRTASLSRLADTYGRTTIQILMANGGIEHTIDAMRRMEPAAVRARQLLDNFNGDVEQLSGSFETLSTNVILPMLRRVFRPLVQGLTRLVNVILEADPAVIEFISNFVLFGSILATIVGALAIAVGGLLYFGGVVSSVASGLVLLSVAPGIAIAAIGSLGVALLGLVTVGTVVIGGLSLLSMFMTELFSLIEDNVGGAGDALNGFRTMISNVATELGKLLDNVTGVVRELTGMNNVADRIVRGSEIANFFNRLSASTAVVWAQLSQINGVLTGFRGFLSFNRDMATATELAASASEEFTNMRQTMLRGSVRQVSDEYTQLMNDMTKNPLVRQMLGQDVTVAEVEQFFNVLKTQLTKLIGGLRDVGAGLMGMLFNVEGSEERVKQGLNSLLGQLAAVIHNRTDINLLDAFFRFGEGDLQGGVRSMVGALLEELRLSILANEETITNILTGIFNYFTPGRIIMPLADILGLHQVGELATNVFGIIESAFRRLVGTFFDLLEGQTLEEALVGNFGPAIRPVIRLIQSLGRAVDTIVGIFGRLFNVLFPSGGSAAGGSFLEVALNGIATILEGFTQAILLPLSLGVNLFTLLGNRISMLWVAITGGFPAALDAITQFLTGIGSSLTDRINELDLAGKIGGLLGGLKDAIANLNLDDKIGEAAQAIADKVNLAIQRVPEFLSNLGAAIGFDLLYQFGEDLKKGDFGTAISNLAQGLAANIWSAIQQVPTLVSELLSGGDPYPNARWPVEWMDGFMRQGEDAAGEGGASNSFVDTITQTISTAFTTAVEGIALASLADPLTRRIAEAVAAGNWADVNTAMIFGATSTINTAIKDTLPKLLVVIGDSLNLQFLVDFGMSMLDSAAFKLFVDAFTLLANIGGTVISQIVSALQGIREFWAAASDEGKTAVGAMAGMTALFYALAALGAKGRDLKGIGMILSSIFGGIKSVALFALKFGILAGAFLIFTSAMENLKKVAEGDWHGFIVDTLVDIMEALADLVGLEFDGESMTKNISRALTIVERTLDRIIENLRTTLQNMINDMITLTNQVALSFRPGDEKSQQFFAIQAELAGRPGDINFDTVLDNFEAAMLDPANRQGFSTLLKSMSTEVVNGFIANMQRAATENAMSDDEFASMIGVLINSEAINRPEITDRIIGMGEGPMQRILTRMMQADIPEEAKTNFYNNLVDSMQDAIISGTGTREEAINLMALLVGSGELSAEDAERFVAEINETLSTLEEDIRPVEISARINEIMPTDFSTTTGDHYRTPPTGVTMEMPVDVQAVDSTTGTIFSTDPEERRQRLIEFLTDQFDLGDQTGQVFTLTSMAGATFNLDVSGTEFVLTDASGTELATGGMEDPYGIVAQIQNAMLNAPVPVESLNVEVRSVSTFVTEEAKQQMLADLQEELNTAPEGFYSDAPVSEGGGTSGITVNGGLVRVDVDQIDVEVDPVAEEQARREMMNLFRDGADTAPAGGGISRGGMGSKVPRMNMPMQVTIETAINQEQVDEAEQALDGMGIKATNVRDSVNQASGSFAGFSSNALLNALLASSVWSAQALVIMGVNILLKSSIDGVAGAVQGVSDKIIGVNETITTNAPLIAGGFDLLWSLSRTPLDNLILKLEDVETAALNVGTALEGSIPGLDVAINPDGNRQQGGPVSRTGIYRVTENGAPELLTIGGETYLLPGQDGYVHPISRPVSGPPPRLGNGGGYGGSNLVYHEGDVTIQVNATPGMNVDQLANTIQQRIDLHRADNQRAIKRELVRTGRV